MLQLAQLGSMSATIITNLQLTREIYKEALDDLQQERAAQITLTCILSANRFRVHYQGSVLRSRCGRCRREEDSFAHMLRCYDLQDQLNKGANAAPFLAHMARTVKLSPPGVSVPIVEDL